MAYPTQRQATSRSVHAHQFSDVPPPSVQRSRLPRPSRLHTAFNSGKLIPVYRDELLPGDTLTMQYTFLARLLPVIEAVMSGIYLDVHFFAVPFRLIWENAEEFFGAEPGGPGTRVDRLTPKVDVSSPLAEDSLYDYLGYPPGISDATSSRWPNNLYARAYSLICTDWYRHAELVAPYHLDLDDGPDDPADYPIRNRMKRYDYFTQAALSPQKGPDVTVPLGTSAPLSGSIAGGGAPSFKVSAGDTAQELEINATANNQQVDIDAAGFAAAGDLIWGDPNLDVSGVTADLSSASSSTINELRIAFATQHVYEAFARGGVARYTELLQSIWGVQSPDARLQRPEFLGGSTIDITVAPIPNTSGVGTLAELGALAVGVKRGRGFTYSSTEHQLVLGIASVRADLIYSQGLGRDLTRDTRFDYQWPAFNYVGEQAVYSRELYWDGTANDLDVFGYVPRYDEYRHKNSETTGPMRPQHSVTLAYYHLGQDFASRPALNETFMNEAPPMDRILQISTEADVRVDAFFQATHVRPIPPHGRPGLMRL